MLQVAALISNVQDSINDLRACWEVQDNEISYLTKTLASKQPSNISCGKCCSCLIVFQINCWKLEQKVLLSITALYTASEHLHGVLQRKDLCKACMDSGHWLFQLYQVYIVLCFCALCVTCIFYFIHIVKLSVCKVCHKNT